jgi:hypothetical protein
MQHLITLLAITALISTTALAQQPTPPRTNTPAVTTLNSPPNPAAPVPGANSFTEGQAKSRIEARGYTQVSGLAKDGDGVWRGKAVKGGKTVSISVDFEGNVTEQ